MTTNPAGPAANPNGGAKTNQIPSGYAGDVIHRHRAWMLLKKPMKTIAKYYTKWYDFAYILNQEGLKNQGVKNMDWVKSGKI